MMIPIKYNIRSLLVRKATTVATALGIALVVCVLTSALMLSAGITKTMATAGRSDVAIVLRKGSDNEMGSTVEDPQVGLVKSMPGVKKEGTTPIGSAEVVVVAAMNKVGVDGITNVSIRGMTEDGRKLRPRVKVVAGRLPSAGADEVMVGVRIRGRIEGLDLEKSFDLKKNRPVKVVGIFEDGGSSSESEVWTDLDVLRSSFGREGGVSSVRLQLESNESFDGLKTALEGDKRMGLMAEREDKYFEKQSQFLSIFIGVLGGLIAFFCSVGAMVGAAITMYAAVANRQREIGTLRALGFSRSSILFCFVAESTLLAVVGGVVGLIAAMGVGTIKFSMINFASWSEMVFAFEATPGILLTGFLFALILGVVGGFLPALRAARVSPLAAMRG
jgi:putative ABC transport system permease protein